MLFFFGYLITGGIFAQISSIIDGCDGEVARLKFLESEFGGWFDAVLDRYADGLILSGLTYHVFSTTGNPASLIVGLLAIIGSFVNSYTADKYDGLMRKKFGSSGFRLGRDVRMFIVFIFAVLNLPLVLLVLIATLMNLENIRRIIFVYKNTV